MTQSVQTPITNTAPEDSSTRELLTLASVAALLAMAANVLDVVLGFGDTEVFTYGTKTAVDWFA